MGVVVSISFVIRAISSVGKASGAGLPAAKLIPSGSDVNLSISLIADGCNVCTLYENAFIFIYRSYRRINGMTFPPCIYFVMGERHIGSAAVTIVLFYHTFKRNARFLSAKTQLQLPVYGCKVSTHSMISEIHLTN